MAFLFRRLEVRDIAFLFQNAGNLRLQVGSGNIYLLVPRADRIANSREHVCDRIGQLHTFCFSSAARSLRLSGEPAMAANTQLSFRRWSFVVGHPRAWRHFWPTTDDVP